MRSAAIIISSIICLLELPLFVHQYHLLRAYLPNGFGQYSGELRHESILNEAAWRRDMSLRYGLNELWNPDDDDISHRAVQFYSSGTSRESLIGHKLIDESNLIRPLSSAEFIQMSSYIDRNRHYNAAVDMVPVIMIVVLFVYIPSILMVIVLGGYLLYLRLYVDALILAIPPVLFYFLMSYVVNSAGS